MTYKNSMVIFPYKTASHNYVPTSSPSSLRDRNMAATYKRIYELYRLMAIQFGVVRHLCYHQCLQEEANPFFIGSGDFHRCQTGEIWELAQVEDSWKIDGSSLENTALIEEEQCEQLSHAPVTVNERMDNLKLVMDECRFNKRMHIVIGIDVLFKVIESFEHVIGCRWNERCRLEGVVLISPHLLP